MSQKARRFLLGTFARLAQPFFALEFAGDAAPIFESRKFRAEVLYRRRDAIYLPLLHDIMALEKPALVVTLGLVDAQAHLSFCQTAAQQNILSRCAAIRRATPAW